jgi:hypothetical protein
MGMEILILRMTKWQLQLATPSDFVYDFMEAMFPSLMEDYVD